MLVQLFCFLSVITTALSSYSLGYYSQSFSKILNAGIHYFRDAPTAEHVADIYSRISGAAPLLREGKKAYE